MNRSSIGLLILFIVCALHFSATAQNITDSSDVKANVVNEEKETISKEEQQRLNTRKKFDKKYKRKRKKAEKSFSRGFYASAHSRFNFFIKREFIFDSTSHVLMSLNLLRAKYDVGRGLFEQAENELQKGVNMFYSYGDINHPLYFNVLKDLVDAANYLGRPILAYNALQYSYNKLYGDSFKTSVFTQNDYNNWLDTATVLNETPKKRKSPNNQIEILLKTKGLDSLEMAKRLEQISLTASWNSADSIQMSKMEKLLIETQIARGNYADAIKRVDKTLPKFQSLTDKKQWTYNEKNADYQYKSVKKKERKKFYEDYASLLLYKADLQRLIGNYFEAMDLYEKNQNEMGRYVKGNSYQFFRNDLGIALIYEDLHDYKKSRKELKSLHKNLRQSNKISRHHLFYYETTRDLAIVYNEEDKHRKFKKLTKKYRDDTRLKHGKENPHYLDSRVLLNERLVSRNPKRANRRLVRFEELGEENIPQFSNYRKYFHDQFYQIYLNRNQFNDAAIVLDKNIEIDAFNLGKDAPLYHKTVLEKAAFELSYTNRFNIADSLMDNSLAKCVFEQLHPYHNDYLNLLLKQANLKFEIDQFDEALRILEQSRMIAFKKFGRKSAIYGTVLERMAQVFMKKSEFEKAEELLEQAEEIIRSDAGRRNLAYGQLLRTLGELYALNGKLEEAQSTIKRSQRIISRTNSKDFEEVATTDDLILLNLRQGNYAIAEDLIKKTIELRESKFGKVHYQLILPYNYLGQWELLNGDFTKAESAAKNAIDITVQTVSDTSSRYNENLTLLAEIYKEMGDIPNAVSTYKKIIANNKKIYGFKSVKTAESFIGISRAINRMPDRSVDVILYADSALLFISELLSTEHPLYAQALQIKARAQIKMKEYTAAEKNLQQAGNILEKTYGSRNVLVADNITYLANLYYAIDKYQEAIKAYENAADVYRRIFSRSHPKYVKSRSSIAYCNYQLENYQIAKEILNESISEYLVFLDNYFPALSEREKFNYWNSIQSDFEFFYGLGAVYGIQNTDILGNMYDYRLETKAILLNSSIKVRQRILSSNNEELIQAYLSWVEKKELLTRALSMSQEDQQRDGINFSQIEKDINSLEKFLSKSSEVFANAKDDVNVSLKDVAKSLENGEVAIEIIRFRTFDKQFTDEVKYAALIVDAKSKKAPKIVVLDNGNDLEKKFYSYYRNTIKYKVQDKNSYAQYWSKIEAALPFGTKTIYLSADGVYNQLNIETFQNDGGRFIIEDYLVYNLSNTKEIVLEKGKEPELYSNSLALLMGNPDFSENENTDLRTHNAVSSIEPLPGAESEVKAIDAVMKNGNWFTETYLNENATEGKLKEMNSPRILHIATHGFFMEVELDDEEKGDNPLLKSGLLFVDAGKLLAENNVYNFNRKDGILTAYEAMNLNLDQTEIVVLSACETGLGEIRAGEGVFGLQRSFIVAGAQNVIMTLFKVNDEITEELMTNFYTEWLATGNKRKAFVNAKLKIKEKYESPIYWGSFVMVGLD